MLIADTQEIALRDQRLATARLNEERKRIGLEVWELEAKSGVSASAFFAWKAGKRAPVLSCMVAVAQTLGFETVLRNRTGCEHRIYNAKAAMEAINVERRSRGWGLPKSESASGVSAATFFALASGKRDVRMPTIVAIADAFGFELILRRMP